MTTSAVSARAGEPAYTASVLRREAASLLEGLRECADLSEARRLLRQRMSRIRAGTFSRHAPEAAHELARVRDCVRVINSILNERSEQRVGFSVAQALWDVARGVRRKDLRPAFFAEMIHLFRGLLRREPFHFLADARAHEDLTGRRAAIARSDDLDRLWQAVEGRMARFADGLSADAQGRRRVRKRQVAKALGASQKDWNDWKWQVAHILKDADALGRVAPLNAAERRNIARARKGRLPFAVTPYYATLMDETPSDRDRAVRAQVLPPADYVEHMIASRGKGGACDFMLEADTSPIDLVTRRYPAIAILKPFNTCPQICVYCQRNWEIQEAMAPDAFAGREAIDAAIDWIARHPSIREVLITGGDPLAMDDRTLQWMLSRLAEIQAIDLIRLGTRMIVTVPMRITRRLADMLGSFRALGRRDLAVVTHVEHPYEITPEMALAVDRLRRAGVAVYNQLVYTFFVSRRFESAKLRLLLRRIGIDPYYTFAPKGKEETAAYRLPLARILQEQKEEARLLPGLRRTDEAVYNLPGLGKNYLRAVQHRDLLSILPDGARVYEFHPWEKNVVHSPSYVGADIPILDYLQRLERIGENPDDYASIWYYF